MTKERTDTERLDWMIRTEAFVEKSVQPAGGYFCSTDGHTEYHHATPRGVIDAAMDEEEGE